MNCRLIVVTFLSVLITSCSIHKQVASSTSFKTSVYKQYTIDTTYKPDTEIASFLQPYAIEVNKQMNVVIGSTETPLERKTPEGTLGNFVADAMLERASLSYKEKVDVAFVNYGGLRINNIAAGPITLGKIYELMPFDNIIVLLKVDGKQLRNILDVIASKDGWPITGVKMKISNGKATDISVNNHPLNDTTNYTLATTDYTAKGNEGFEMLTTIKQVNNGYLFRDALIDYVKDMNQKGLKIKATIEDRITNVE